MYVVTIKGKSRVYTGSSLANALQIAIARGPGSWIWQLAVTRLGTLKRIEVPREELTAFAKVIGLDISYIKNRCQADLREPVDGQLYFTSDAGEVAFKTYTGPR